MRPAELRFTQLLTRYPALDACRDQVADAYELLRSSYETGGKALFCGNGGSCADCAHIVGELMKGFVLPRRLDKDTVAALERVAGPRGLEIAAKLQQGLPAIDLCANTALMTAVANDNSPDLIFAQQVM